MSMLSEMLLWPKVLLRFCVFYSCFIFITDNLWVYYKHTQVLVRLIHEVWRWRKIKLTQLMCVFSVCVQCLVTRGHRGDPVWSLWSLWSTSHSLLSFCAQWLKNTTSMLAPGWKFIKHENLKALHEIRVKEETGAARGGSRTRLIWVHRLGWVERREDEDN